MSTIQGTQGIDKGARVTETLERARHAADGAAETAANFAKKRIDDAEKLTHEAVGAAKSAGDAAVNTARHLPSDAARLARESVAQYPLVALGAAAAFGVVVGMLIRR